jgi:chemotaxis methyl-accepting protein methylase
VNGSLAALAELVHEASGIVLADGQEQALGAALRRAAPEFDASQFLAEARVAPGGRRLVERLVDEIAVKETTFLRDSGQLNAIDWHGLLECAHRRGASTIRVWSAACATGEEPYTLALLAARAFGGNQPPVDVLGTDISAAALAQARAGRYRERAMRHVDRPSRQRFFAVDGADYVVGEQLRRHVRFERHNLVRDPIPPLGEAPFDLIVCRNVLIYFDVPTIDRVRGALGRALESGGTLVLGAADSLGGSSAPSGTLAEPLPPVAAASPVRELRRPLGRTDGFSRDELLRQALAAADAGRCDEARAHTATLLRRVPLDADAHFVLGIVELEDGSPRAAVASLRRALYVDPDFGIAAFALACAYDSLGDHGAARRAYEQAVRTIDPADDRHGALLEQIDLRNLTEACLLRLDAHAAAGGPR